MAHRQRNLKELLRVRRHKSVRKRIFGTENKPRLVVHRSNRSIQAHLIDDVKGTVMVGVSSLSKKIEVEIFE